LVTDRVKLFIVVDAADRASGHAFAVIHQLPRGTHATLTIRFEAGVRSLRVGARWLTSGCVAAIQHTNRTLNLIDIAARSHAPGITVNLDPVQRPALIDECQVALTYTRPGRVTSVEQTVLIVDFGLISTDVFDTAAENAIHVLEITTRGDVGWWWRRTWYRRIGSDATSSGGILIIINDVTVPDQSRTVRSVANVGAVSERDVIGRISIIVPTQSSHTSVGGSGHVDDKSVSGPLDSQTKLGIIPGV